MEDEGPGAYPSAGDPDGGCCQTAPKRPAAVVPPSTTLAVCAHPPKGITKKRHCGDCGALINAEAMRSQNCKIGHAAWRDKGYKFCPDNGCPLT